MIIKYIVFNICYKNPTNVEIFKSKIESDIR